jgi:hypothetical protein
VAAFYNNPRVHHQVTQLPEVAVQKLLVKGVIQQYLLAAAAAAKTLLLQHCLQLSNA